VQVPTDAHRPRAHPGCEQGRAGLRVHGAGADAATPPTRASGAKPPTEADRPAQEERGSQEGERPASGPWGGAVKPSPASRAGPRWSAASGPPGTNRRLSTTGPDRMDTCPTGRDDDLGGGHAEGDR